MRHLILGIGVFAWAVIASAAPPGADDLCGSRDEILGHLDGKYREKPVAMGVALNGGFVELLRSTAGATWTIVITKPDGATCVVVAGEDWEDLPEITGSKI